MSLKLHFGPQLDVQECVERQDIGGGTGDWGRGEGMQMSCSSSLSRSERRPEDEIAAAGGQSDGVLLFCWNADLSPHYIKDREAN